MIITIKIDVLNFQNNSLILEYYFGVSKKIEKDSFEILLNI